jgi:hypothetical protein
MSVAATNYVWTQSPAEGADRLVLLALADFADEEGNCFGSWGKLEEKTRLARATVARCLRRLQDRGELIMVEKGHRKLAGDGAEASIWKIPGVANEMGLRMRPVSERDPSSVRMRPKWCQNETPTISNIKERNKGADAPAAATASPSLPSFSPKRPSPPKFDPASLPLPHGAGLARAWAEFAQHRREIKAPLTPTAAKRIVDDLGAVNESVAVEALRKSVKHGWRGVFIDRPAEAPKVVPMPTGPRQPSAAERRMLDMEQKMRGAA